MTSPLMIYYHLDKQQETVKDYFNTWNASLQEAKAIAWEDVMKEENCKQRLQHPVEFHVPFPLD